MQNTEIGIMGTFTDVVVPLAASNTNGKFSFKTSDSEGGSSMLIFHITQ